MKNDDSFGVFPRHHVDGHGSPVVRPGSHHLSRRTCLPVLQRRSQLRRRRHCRFAPDEGLSLPGARRPARLPAVACGLRPARPIGLTPLNQWVDQFSLAEVGHFSRASKRVSPEGVAVVVRWVVQLRPDV